MSKPTQQQYVTAIEGILDDHSITLSPRNRDTHIAAIADLLVQQDAGSGKRKTRRLVDGYLRENGLGSLIATVAPALSDLRQWRNEVINGRLVLSDDASGASSTSVDPGATDSGFDRESAASVIRAFIQSDQPHLTAARRKGASAEQVDALLQIAGLVDAPASEPDVANAESFIVNHQVDSLAQAVAGLLAFARRHGYQG